MRLERITLIRPNIGNFRSSDALHPIAMGMLAARVPKNTEVSFFDDKVEELPKGDTPSIVAITVETFTARRAYKIAREYRSRGVPVVMGGYHPTFLPDEALTYADAVVTGDAEGVWEDLLADFENGRMRRIYRGDNSRPLSGVNTNREIFRGKRYAPLEVSWYARGCRFACDFCSISAFYKSKARTRPLDELVSELRALDGRKLVFFVDDNLFSSRPELEAFLAAITPLRIRWSCQITIDVARDDHLLEKMSAAGCTFALIGFESINESSLRQMGKRWNKVGGDYRDVVRRFHERGMALYGTFVFGYDGDTLESIDYALEFAESAKIEVGNFNMLTPTPGSPLYGRLEKEGRLLRPLWWNDPSYRFGDPIFIPKCMDPYKFAEKCYEARRAFYSVGSITRRVLGSDAGIDWFRTGAMLAANIVSRSEIVKKHHRLLGD